jgi:hypothetical protein
MKYKWHFVVPPSNWNLPSDWDMDRRTGLYEWHNG